MKYLLLYVQYGQLLLVTWAAVALVCGVFYLFRVSWIGKNIEARIIEDRRREIENSPIPGEVRRQHKRIDLIMENASVFLLFGVFLWMFRTVNSPSGELYMDLRRVQMGDSFPWENIISFLVEAFLFTAAWALTLGLIPYVIYHGRRWLVSIHRNARQQS